MLGKVYSVLFILLLLFGVWFQRTYSKMYSEEFSSEKGMDRSSMEIIHARDVSSHQYRQGVRDSVFEARDVSFLNSGKLFINGNFRYQGTRPDDGTVFSLNADTVIANVHTVKAARSFLDSSHQLQNFEIPGKVLFRLGFDTLETTQLKGNLQARTMRSSSPVRVNGPGRELQGVGFSYAHIPGDLEIGGPLSMEFIPPEKSTQKK